MDDLDDGLERLDRGLGQDAVAEVEDVAGAAGGAPQHVARPLEQHVARPEQQRRIEVALDRAVADVAPRPVQRDPPVDADDVAPRGREIPEEGAAHGAGRAASRGPGWRGGRRGGGGAPGAGLGRGRAFGGPSPAANDSPRPSGSNGRRMSAKMIAASTPSRAIGWSVAWAAS